MSLLLEALKKAELAKQAAKEQPPATDKPPLTRDKLPDISQPMEIRSDDLSLVESAPTAPAPAPKRADKPVLELALEEPPRAAPPEAPPAREAPAEAEFTPPDEAVERKQAQQLFEAKELDVNPRKPFYITLGALGLFAVGAAGYIWYEMQPKSNYKIPPPSAQSSEPPTAAAPAVQPAAPMATTVTPPLGTSPLPPAGAATAPAAAPAPATPSIAASAARGQVPARETATAAPSQAAAREGDIRITPAKVQTDPVLEAAYQAFNAGDLARARDDYQQALRNTPDSRDALLGLAAVETQTKRHDAAEAYYTRLLELDPRDAYAQAGLIGLRGQMNPLSAESRLKSMIAEQPDASFLQFSLGNQYAAQGHWAEAQHAYFRAYTGDPEHPDFAYNLAVSLDQLHQPKQALEYYRRALKLAQGHPVSFDPAQVSKRVSLLAR